MQKKIQIIYLNGPSSSGKTTLAKALQEALKEPFLHLGLDKMIEWMPEKINDWRGEGPVSGFSWEKKEDQEGAIIYALKMGPFAKKLNSSFLEVVYLLASLNHDMIIDDISFGKEGLRLWQEKLKPFSVLWVKVDAPLPVLETRERQRGNRMVGSSRHQFYHVHRDASYDLEIDTHHEKTSLSVERILRKV